MTHPKDYDERSSVPYEGRLVGAFPITEGGAPVREMIKDTLHGRTVEDRAEALIDLLDYLGVFGPKVPMVTLAEAQAAVERERALGKVTK